MLIPCYNVLIAFFTLLLARVQVEDTSNIDKVARRVHLT
jgi:hypothetical protein